MTLRFSHLIAAAALATLMSLPAAAQEYSNGGKGAAGRGPAILTPVEALGVHPPGPDPAEAGHGKPYIPYYAPLSPVASSTRWKPWCYAPLLPYYTPYYTGYSPHRLFNPRPRPYGCDGWGKGPMPERDLPEKPGKTPLRYGDYTSVVDDDTTYWNMGGNGLVPYGADESFRSGPPDLIDAIQSSRPSGHAHIHAAPSLEPPMTFIIEEADGKPQPTPRSAPTPSRPKTKTAERIPPGVSD